MEMITMPKFAAAAVLVAFASLHVVAQAKPLIQPGDRVLCIGDSITAAGHYVSFLDMQLQVQYPNDAPIVLNLGLPSEGVTGLSEPDHPFPRPNVHERLKRALDQFRPDVVIACYGVNDGIYHPYSAKRFGAYQAGIVKLIAEIKQRDISLVLCTPIPFDPGPLRGTGKLLPLDAKKNFAWFAIYENYDKVIGQYAEYIRTNLEGVDRTADVFQDITDTLIARRKSQPNYTMSADGVHIDVAGHLVMARCVTKACGNTWSTVDKTLFELTEKKTKVLHDAWLSEVGHERPGMPKGKPIAEAEELAKENDIAIAARVRRLTPKASAPAAGPLTPVEDVPGLPRVLLIGDSISIGYTLAARAALKDVANVHRPRTNCGPTTKGVKELSGWLGKDKWDVIHFNFGLHDLKWMGPNGENLAEPNKTGNHPQVSIEDYKKNLEIIVRGLKKTGAVLIWRNTTPVPKGARGRVVGDSVKYNSAALEVMKRHDIQVDDMYCYSLAKQTEIQKPKDVHFTREGSVFLGKKVAEAIRGQLKQR
jgi:lysophospholipase L1-like esterase